MNLRNLELKHSVNLKPYTTIKIGGNAENFFVAHSLDELRSIVKEAAGSFYLLGGGSNLLIKDSLIAKYVIKLGTAFRYVKEKQDGVCVGGATPLSWVIRFCIQQKQDGVNALAGIPATVGGLLAMNASAYGQSMGAVVKEVEVMDQWGETKTLQKNEIVFEYRKSSLKKYIVLSAVLHLKTCQNNSKINVRDFLVRRQITQDLHLPSCGCIFKNSPLYSSGYMIDQCGLKGLRKNDAQISLKHGNFIVNCGNARYDDVDYLIQIIKEKVYNKYNILLDEEIERWG